MAEVRTFTIRRENNDGFAINSDFAKNELSRALKRCEEAPGISRPHKTLNIIPEFPQKTISPGRILAENIPVSFCKNDMVVALHCIATF